MTVTPGVLSAFVLMILLLQREALAQESKQRLCTRNFALLPFVSKPKDPTITPKCYRFFNQKVTFEQALERCDRVGATLATPKHLAEAESIANYVLKNRPNTRRYWIGLSDQEEEGVFKWEDDGSELAANFSSWTVTQPDSGSARTGDRGEEQDCVKMTIWIFGAKSSGQFYDSHCHEMESFVCEKDPIQKVEPVVEEPVYKNATNGTEKEVDFILPKSRLESPRNVSNGGGGNGSRTDVGEEQEENREKGGEEEDDEETYPMRVTASYEDLEEAFEPRMMMSNVTVQPEIQNLPPKDQPTEDLAEPLEVEETEVKSNETKPVQKGKKRRTCSLECLENHMKAACPLEYFPQMEHTKVVLNNKTCRPRRNRTHLIVFTKLDHCGTTVENVPRKNELSFKNTIHIITSGAGIVRSRNQAKAMTELMQLDCRYPQRHSLSHEFQPAEGKPPVYKTQSRGEEFNHVMLLYKTKKYECPYAREEYPVEVPLSQRVFLEVMLNMQSDRVELHPITCFATPDENPYNSNNYVMMQDGCMEDETFQIEDSDSRKISRFSVEAFRFVGYFRQVYVHCKLIVCRINSESSPECPYACDPERKYRRKRSNEDESNGHARREITGHTGRIQIVDQIPAGLHQSLGEVKEPEPVVNDKADKENSAMTIFPHSLSFFITWAMARLLLQVE